MELIFFTIVAILLSAWIINRWYLRKSVKLANKIGSNKWHTFLGWGKLVKAKDMLEFMYNYLSKFGPNCIFWLGPFPIFFSSDPQVLKEILTSKNCVNKPQLVYSGITLIANNGLISANEPFWGRHRKIMNRAFSNKNLIAYITLFQTEIDKIIEEMNENLDKGGTIDMLFIFRELTLRNTTKTILKRDFQQTEYNADKMITQVSGILDYIAEACVNYFLKVNIIRKLAEIFVFKTAAEGLDDFKKLIAESWNILTENNTTHPSYCHGVNSALDYALNGVNQNIITEDEIKGEMIQLFAGAFETTSTTLFLLLSLLAMHPEYQERAYEEIISIQPINDNSDLTLEQIDQLVYLEMVFNETMRVLPIVPMVFRQVSNTDLVLTNGLTLPVGQRIGIDIYSLHRNKELWGPDAGLFNPDNFLPSNVAARHPFSFIPFTKGVRFCIGWRYAIMFAKISLAKLIKTYKFSTDYKFTDLKYTNHITLKLMEEPRLNLERRNISK